MRHQNSKMDLSAMTFAQYMTSLKILHLAMCVGTAFVIIALVNVIGLSSLSFQNMDIQKVVLFLMGAIAIIYLGHTLSNKKINDISGSDSLDSKLMSYRIAKVILFALTEGPAMICIILGFVWKEAGLFIGGGLIIAYLLSQRPTADQLKTDVPFSSEEKSYLNGNSTLGEWESQRK